MSQSIDRARALRRNLTDTERFVWARLRNRRFCEFKFRRQTPLGNYIVDFVCFSQRVIVEVDGGQHNEPSAREYDERRSEWLRSQGFRILRFWNHEVFEDWGVVEEAIWQALQEGSNPGSNPRHK